MTAKVFKILLFAFVTFILSNIAFDASAFGAAADAVNSTVDEPTVPINLRNLYYLDSIQAKNDLEDERQAPFFRNLIEREVLPLLDPFPEYWTLPAIAEDVRDATSLLLALTGCRAHAAIFATDEKTANYRIVETVGRRWIDETHVDIAIDRWIEVKRMHSLYVFTTNLIKPTAKFELVSVNGKWFFFDGRDMGRKVSYDPEFHYTAATALAESLFNEAEKVILDREAEKAISDRGDARV